MHFNFLWALYSQQKLTQLADYDRYLELKILKKCAAKYFQEIWKDFLWLDHYLFLKIKKSVVIKLSDYDDSQKEFTAAVRLFLQLNLTIFTTVISTIWIFKSMSMSMNSSIKKSQC